MNRSFQVLRMFEEKGFIRPHFMTNSTDDLDVGEVVVQIAYSGINYKDALGVTARGKIYKKLPIIGGIDLSGTVVQSSHSRFKVGDSVLAHGCGLGESHDGGFAEFARVPADWIVPLPSGLSLREAMILGTAGFTAALSLKRMEQNGQHPSKGPIVVTGASGGVGSVAVNLFSQRGYEVVAVSGKSELKKYLQHLGAKEVVNEDALKLGKRPLESARFGGVVDNVGGELLSGLIRHTALWGNVACIGLAARAEVSMTVMPLILRGVSLLGISSANCPQDLREEIWKHLGTDWKPTCLEEMVSREVSLGEVPEVCQAMVERKTHGRILVCLLSNKTT